MMTVEITHAAFGVGFFAVWVMVGTILSDRSGM